MTETTPFVIRNRTPLLAVLVMVVGFAAHVSSVAGGFVYDDHRFIEQNDAIRTVDPVRFFADASSASHGAGITHDIYRPLRTLLFSLEYALFGTNPTGWHAISLLLHLLNAALVYVVLRVWLRGNDLIAAAGAAVFAAHPATVETVAWVSSQGDLLALTFMLAALLVLRRPGLRASSIGVGLFALACFAKESALVLPALVFLQDLVLRGRPEPSPDQPPWRTTWVRMGAMAAVVVLYFVLRQSVVPVLAQVGHPGDSVWASVRGLLSSLVWYLGVLVAPHGFTFDVKLDVPLRFGEPVVVVGLGLLMSTVLLGLFGLVTRRFVVALAALGFLACLVPVSNVIVPLKAFVAERFLYPGLVFVAAGVAAACLALGGRGRAVFLGVVACVLVWFVAVAQARTDGWRDEAGLWDAVRNDRPTNPNAYQGLAFAWFQADRVKDAERAFETYLGFNRVDGKAWKLRGDNFGKAAARLEVVARPGEQTSIRKNRSLALMAQIDAYRQAIDIWDRWNLVKGRGSPEMRRSMLIQWMDAGFELGDVATQNQANDRLLDDDGVDPDDLDDVWTRGAWPRRFARLRIAIQVLHREIKPDPDDPAAYSAALRQRAVALRHARLDPSRPNDRLRPLLSAAVVAMLEEPGVVLSPDAFEQIARSLAEIEQQADAVRVLEIAVRAHPESARLAELRDLAAKKPQ